MHLKEKKRLHHKRIWIHRAWSANERSNLFPSSFAHKQVFLIIHPACSLIILVSSKVLIKRHCSYQEGEGYSGVYRKEETKDRWLDWEKSFCF